MPYLLKRLITTFLLGLMVLTTGTPGGATLRVSPIGVQMDEIVDAAGAEGARQNEQQQVARKTSERPRLYLHPKRLYNRNSPPVLVALESINPRDPPYHFNRGPPTPFIPLA
jgi:hypothetical protein